MCDELKHLPFVYSEDINSVEEEAMKYKERFKVLN
jgi:hypothetical protein